MRWLLFFLLIVILGSLVLWLFIDPGMIQIEWFGYEVRLPALLACLLFLVFLSLLLFVFRFFLWLNRLSKVKHVSRDTKAQEGLLDLISALEADVITDALYHQKKLGPRLKNNPLFLWLSGQSFEKAHQPYDAEAYFMDLAKSPEGEFLSLKGRIRLALHRHDLTMAYDLLVMAKDLVPRSPWVLKHLIALCREKKDYQEAESLIRRLEDLGYYSEEKSKKQQAFLQWEEALNPNASKEEREASLRQAHMMDPSLEGATEALVPLLIEGGHLTNAKKTIEATWALSPSQKLGELYLNVYNLDNPLEAYQKAVSLVKDNPSHPESLLFLARKALEAKLWGDARVHLNDLLSLRPTMETYSLLAILELDELQDSKAAQKWLMKGLVSLSPKTS